MNLNSFLASCEEIMSFVASSSGVLLDITNYLPEDRLSNFQLTV